MSVSSSVCVRRTVQGVEFLDVAGRFDAERSQVIRQALKEMIDASQRRIVVNLSEVSFIDSVGLSVLLSGMKAVSGIGGEIVLSSIPDNVRSIIELTRLHRVFRIADDETAAIAKFAES